MEEVVINVHETKQVHLAEQLHRLPESFTACFITRINNYQDTVADTLKYLTQERKECGIYISTTRSYKPLVEYLASRGIDSTKLLVIDMIPDRIEIYDGPANCLKMPVPSSLTELSMVILESSAMSQAKFVFFDSVNSFLTYNETQTVEMFFAFMLNKLRESNVAGLGVSLSSMYPDEGLDRIYRLFDRRIEVE